MRGETRIYLCGAHSLAFAAFHLAFWKLFDWPAALRQTDVATRAVTQILNLRLIYVFLGVAALCFWLPGELLATRLGHALLAGMALFWLGRLVEQFVFLRHNKLLLRVLTGLFVLGAVPFALPLTPWAAT
ncbi:hypothetical protein RHOFW104T7_08220 [Rhodanobacter thiooxydans]|uniref:Uncharacterized protein n=1 Tax=Rhodanobacter thiooxydans TaxID=416169 RepID=A0A154QJW4_9GAMM|nr:hypothetical protein [Rhodanobacter thiooxydans]EIM01482.1 hypothetical protein UUA_04353 [Rhodanobacter thiooxydans LCS2]KZC24478.1 hypothetical protein RHOFW104T7_08220 [Rhodanobacter thiooxydans]MCW0203304.1 hypothetical protein [Rhodanobacter thiooxydans]